MVSKIRLGLLGASVSGTWSSRTHFPTLKANSDFELIAVCTTKPEHRSRRKGPGARLTRDDYRAMVASPEIDAVAVLVRVPSHFASAKTALEQRPHGNLRTRRHAGGRRATTPQLETVELLGTQTAGAATGASAFQYRAAWHTATSEAVNIGQLYAGLPGASAATATTTAKASGNVPIGVRNLPHGAPPPRNRRKRNARRCPSADPEGP
jgi:hypothetical protein